MGALTAVVPANRDYPVAYRTIKLECYGSRLGEVGFPGDPTITATGGVGRHNLQGAHGNNGLFFATEVTPEPVLTVGGQWGAVIKNSVASDAYFVTVNGTPRRVTIIDTGEVPVPTYYFVPCSLRDTFTSWHHAVHVFANCQVWGTPRHITKLSSIAKAQGACSTSVLVGLQFFKPLASGFALPSTLTGEI